MKQYKRVGADVIYDNLNNRYFSRVLSEKYIRRKFYTEETKYEVSAQDIEIEMHRKDIGKVFTDGILLTFCKEDDIGENCESDNKCCFLEIIISDLLGTFISDWF